MKFLFVSKDALVTDLAWQCLKEGHEVKYFIGNPSEADVGDGLIPKSGDWKKDVSWADLVIFDDTRGLGKEAENIRKEGKKVIGGTSYTDKLEDFRSFGQEELKRHKINILPYHEFSDFDQAVDFVQNNPNEYVIKPGGEAGNIKQLLFVGQEKDGSDVVRILQSYKKVRGSEIKNFQLQRRADGVEVAVGAFFNGKNFIYPININFEHKKLFPGNLGPATGEMGTAMFWSQPNNLFKNTIGKMETTFAEVGYVGYVDLNCIVNGYGIYPLEFTCRFGYPTISIQQEGINNPIGDFLWELACGGEINLKIKKGFQVGVRILVPPYPFDDKKTFDAYSKKATIVFKQNGRLDGVHVEDVKVIKGEWVVAGSLGVPLVVVGCGLTMKQAKQQAYNRIQNILIPNMYYRTDISDRWEDEGDRLISWGII